MGDGDKISNAAEEAFGAAKEKTGELTGDEELEAEGRTEKAEAEIKQAGEHVKDAAEDAKDAAKDAFDR